MNQYFEFFLGLLATLFVIGYGYGQWKDGRNKSTIDTVALFKDQIDGMDKKMKDQENDIIKLTKEVHDLKLAIEEKDRKLAETIALLQGRDPQMQALIANMNDYLKFGFPLAHRLDGFLDKQGFPKDLLDK